MVERLLTQTWKINIDKGHNLTAETICLNRGLDNLEWRRLLWNFCMCAVVASKSRRGCAVCQCQTSLCNSDAVESRTNRKKENGFFFQAFFSELVEFVLFNRTEFIAEMKFETDWHAFDLRWPRMFWQQIRKKSKVFDFQQEARDFRCIPAKAQSCVNWQFHSKQKEPEDCFDSQIGTRAQVAKIICNETLSCLHKKTVRRKRPLCRYQHDGRLLKSWTSTTWIQISDAWSGHLFHYLKRRNLVFSFSVHNMKLRTNFVAQSRDKVSQCRSGMREKSSELENTWLLCTGVWMRTVSYKIAWRKFNFLVQLTEFLWPLPKSNSCLSNEAAKLRLKFRCAAVSAFLRSSSPHQNTDARGTVLQDFGLETNVWTFVLDVPERCWRVTLMSFLSTAPPIAAQHVSVSWVALSLLPK